jgi:iron complex transport system ATP-binding protein
MTAIQTRDLTIGYAPSNQTPHVVASGLDLALNAGELVCLLGPNGTGKSTLMRTVASMQPGLGGTVELSGSRIEDLAPDERARKLGVVLTERIDVGYLSGYALVSLGRYPYTDWSGRMDEHDHHVVSNAISAVGAEDLADRPIGELSDGERQKMMIARVLAQETDIILLDEPTAFLDLARRVEIVALLKHLAHESGKAILMSTHDLDIAVRNADRIWLMSGGHVQTGIPESLVLNKAFEKTFIREGIEFDEHSGAFRPARQPARTISFSASGLVAAWTCRALERIGFAVVPSDADTDLALHLDDDDGRTIWNLASDTDTAFGTLDDLIAHLRRLPTTTKAPSDG